MEGERKSFSFRNTSLTPQGEELLKGLEKKYEGIDKVSKPSAMGLETNLTISYCKKGIFWRIAEYDGAEHLDTFDPEKPPKNWSQA